MGTVLPERHGWSLFCDDIRDEVGNKQSYMGLYKGVMFVNARFPAVLPGLGIIVNFSEPATSAPGDLLINLYFPGVALDGPPSWSVEVPAADESTLERPSDFPTAEQSRILSFPIRFAPFAIERAGRLHVRIVQGEDVYPAGSLEFRSQD